MSSTSIFLPSLKSLNFFLNSYSRTLLATLDEMLFSSREQVVQGSALRLYGGSWGIEGSILIKVLKPLLF